MRLGDIRDELVSALADDMAVDYPGMPRDELAYEAARMVEDARAAGFLDLEEGKRNG